MGNVGHVLPQTSFQFSKHFYGKLKYLSQNRPSPEARVNILAKSAPVGQIQFEEKQCNL